MNRVFFLAIFILFFIVNEIFAQNSDQKEKLVILNLRNLNGISEDSAEAVTETLVTSFGKRDKYIILERGQLVNILEELKLTQNEEFNDEEILKVGKLAKAKNVLIGSVSKLGDKIVLNIRVIEVETASVKISENLSVESEDKLYDAVQIIVGLLCGDFKKDDNIIKDYEQANKEERDFIAIDLRFIEKIDTNYFIKKRNERKVKTEFGYYNVNFKKLKDLIVIRVDFFLNDMPIATYVREVTLKKGKIIKQLQNLFPPSDDIKSKERLRIKIRNFKPNLDVYMPDKSNNNIDFVVLVSKE